MEIKELLEEVKPYIAETISKTGEFELVENQMDRLEGKLNGEQIVSLYIYIRDESQRLEEEWRDAFIEFFPNVEDILPDPLY